MKQSYKELIDELTQKVQEKHYRAVNLIKPYSNEFIKFYSGYFDNNDDTPILERCFAKRIENITIEHPTRPYFDTNPVNFFSICSDYARIHPEITYESVVKFAEHKFNEDFAMAVAKLDLTQWELEISAGIIAEKIKLT